MGKFHIFMENQMSIRGFSEKTKEAYLKCMKMFVRHFMISPDKLTVNNINDYQLYLTKEKRVAWSTFNQSVCAIRFFYKNVMKNNWNIELIPYQRKERRLRVILRKEEIFRLLNGTDNLKWKAIIYTLYSTGMRPQEVTNLTVNADQW